jgi:hypothetical protein
VEITLVLFDVLKISSTMLVNVESELPEAMLDQASDSKIRKAQKTKTLKNFSRVCHDPSRWITKVTPRPAVAASIRRRASGKALCIALIASTRTLKTTFKASQNTD